MKQEVVTNNGLRLVFSKKSQGVDKLFEKALAKEPKTSKDKLLQELIGEENESPDK